MTKWIPARAVVLLAACIALLPAARAAPPGHTVRVGVLFPIAPSFDPAVSPVARELFDGLRELGYTPGQDIAFEFRSAEGNAEALPRLANELVALKPDLLLITGTEAVLSAAEIIKTIPVVIVGTADVVETGLVQSLAHPGGNITGLAINAAEIAAKRVQLLQEAVPRLSKVAVLWNGSVQSMTLGFQNIEKASPQLGVTIQSVRVTSSDDFDRAFAAIEAGHPDGLVVLYGPLRGNDLPRIVEFVTQQKLPTIFESGQGVRGGGLMEFGALFSKMARRAAFYIDKIANGANPAELPVEEPSEFFLVINMKAAKKMGFDVPQPLLLRADRVIE
jgi:putative tryptophan/tyrosine transport system substrate-binding protein